MRFKVYNCRVHVRCCYLAIRSAYVTSHNVHPKPKKEKIFIRWPMTLTFERNLDRVKMNQHTKYLGHKSFSTKVIGLTHTRTLTNTWFNCSIWTTEVLGNKGLPPSLSLISRHGDKYETVRSQIRKKAARHFKEHNQSIVERFRPDLIEIM